MFYAGKTHSGFIVKVWRYSVKAYRLPGRLFSDRNHKSRPHIKLGPIVVKLEGKN